jgi:hypothetical protein
MWQLEPLPLPGDLRVVQLGGPDLARSLVGRWQIQLYDARTGSWGALLGKDLSRRSARWRTKSTFATEAEAREHLFGLVQGHRSSG